MFTSVQVALPLRRRGAEASCPTVRSGIIGELIIQVLHELPYPRRIHTQIPLAHARSARRDVLLHAIHACGLVMRVEQGCSSTSADSLKGCA